MRKQAQGNEWPLTLDFNPYCISKTKTPYEDNKYYHSDWLVLPKVLGNKHLENLQDWRVSIYVLTYVLPMNNNNMLIIWFYDLI